LRRGLIRSDNAGNFTAVDESVFFDPFLQGVLIGLCASLDYGQSMTLFRILIGKLAGTNRASNIIHSYQHNLAADKDTIDSGRLNGYREGETIQSFGLYNPAFREQIENPAPVLREHLEQLVYRKQDGA
jgi:hypothetical protein